MSRIRKRHSLKWRLIISFFLLVLIPTSIIGVFSYVSAYGAIEQKISAYSYQVMLQTTNNLDRILGNVEDISLQIVSTRQVQRLLKEANDLTYDDTQVEIENGNYDAIENELNSLLKKYH